MTVWRNYARARSNKIAHTALSLSLSRLESQLHAKCVPAQVFVSCMAANLQVIGVPTYRESSMTRLA